MSRVLMDSLKLGESPIWDHRLNQLYWVDILDKKIYIKNNEVIKFIQMNECVSYLGLIEFTTSKLIVGIESGLYILDFITEKLELLSSFEDENFRCNDGSIDNDGNILIGRMNMRYNDASIPFDFD
ncbi:MAG: SMP-30/gluconolactonase/LRE family protein, partial [Cetobacterium sp.]